MRAASTISTTGRCNCRARSATAPRPSPTGSLLTPPNRTQRTEASGAGMRERAADGAPGVAVLALEVLAACAPSQLRSDPKKDPVRCACWRFRAHHLADATKDEVGVVLVLDAAARRADEPSWRRAWDATDEAVAVEIVADERALVAGLRRLVARLDPDVLLGWDTERGSWGYVEARWGVVAPSDRKQLFSRDTNARALLMCGSTFSL